MQVSTLFDRKFSKISDRQCSWFCYEAMKNRYKLVDYFLANDKKKFFNMYEKCLYIASFYKSTSSCYHEIETLFHNNILSKYNVNMQFYKMEFNVTGPDYYSSLKYPNTAQVISTRRSLEDISENRLYQILINMKRYDYVIINRLIMSFCLVKVKDIYLLLLDPHIKHSYLIDIVDAIKYIDKEQNMYNPVIVAIPDNNQFSL